MRGRSALVWFVVFAMWVVLLPGGPNHGAHMRPRPIPDRVLILTDDMRWDELENMPKTMAFLAANGVRFTQAYVPNSLCCPSRTSILTGQYSDNNGVWRNAAPNEGHTIAVDLHNAGYRTGLVGKYLNQYTASSAKGLAPLPGWDTWIAFLGEPNYFNYLMDRNGTSKTYGTGAANYSTDVVANDAVSFINSAPVGQPFFLEFAPYAAHSPFTPAPKYASALPACASGAQPPGCYRNYTSPNIAEADVNDKPAWVRALKPNAGKTWNGTRKKQELTLLSATRSLGSSRR